MSLTQETFNKLITASLMLFFMIMYVLSFITGKTVDWNQLLVFIVPTLNHIVHQITQNQLTTKNIDARTQKAITQIQVTGTNGTPPQTPIVMPPAVVAAPKGAQPRG